MNEYDNNVKLGNSDKLTKFTSQLMNVPNEMKKSTI